MRKNNWIRNKLFYIMQVNNFDIQIWFRHTATVDLLNYPPLNLVQKLNLHRKFNSSKTLNQLVTTNSPYNLDHLCVFTDY